MVTNFRDPDVEYLENNILKTFEEWFVASNICNDRAFLNLVKIVHMGIKVGLQYMLYMEIYSYMYIMW